MKPVKPVVTKIVKTLDMRGLKQTELESAAALSANRVSKWKDGVGEPSASEACRIARVLNVPLDWLCDDDAPAEPPEPQAAWLDVVMELIRVSGLTREDVVKRLMLGPAKVDVPDPNHPELVAMLVWSVIRTGAGGTTRGRRR